MSWVLATAGHVDHGKSTLVHALTGTDPDRLEAEKARGLSIELGYAWTDLPGTGDVAFVDVPGHQRFIATMLTGLGPSPAVVFVVAADQGWQAQSSEHLAAVRALGVREGVLVITRCDLADDARREQVTAEAVDRLAEAGLDVPVVSASAVTGRGLPELREALVELTGRLPAVDPSAPVRLWTDRAFSIAGAGTVVTGTLGEGTIRVGDELTLLDGGRTRPVVVRGLHSREVARDEVGPVSRVALNLRRVESGEVSRSAVLLTPDSHSLATVVDVELTAIDLEPAGARSSVTNGGRAAGIPASGLPERAVVHVGTAAPEATVRPLGDHHARFTMTDPLPWRVGDRAILRDPGSRRLWAVRVVDVSPLPLRRRGAAAQRARDLEASEHAADLRLDARAGVHPVLLDRLGLDLPTGGVAVGEWWFDPAALQEWVAQVRRDVLAHHADQPLSAGMPIAQVLHRLGLPAHLRGSADGGSLPDDVPAPRADLVEHLVAAAGLALADGRVHDPSAAGLGAAEPAVARVEARLRESTFDAPDRDALADLGLGAAELAAAQRLGRLLRLPDDVVLLPDAPARAMRVLAGLDGPFTLSQARRALGTTRRVAVPLLEHLDGRGWTTRVDGQLREVVR